MKIKNRHHFVNEISFGNLNIPKISDFHNRDIFYRKNELSSTIKKAGIICHPDFDCGELVKKLVKKLKDNNIKVFFDPVIADKINVPGTRISSMDIELAIIIGGDGTILWSLNELACEPLILTINAGRLGFIAELKPDDAISGLNELINGKFRIDKRAKLRIDDKCEALNEVSILPEISGSLLEFEIKLNDKKLVTFRADGVIISTPTGSTAYNLSAGGPIIDHGAKVFAITPVNPFMHRQRPIVVSDDSGISIKLIRKDRDAQLICDGILNKKIQSYDSVDIEKSEKYVKFARF